MSLFLDIFVPQDVWDSRDSLGSAHADCRYAVYGDVVGVRENIAYTEQHSKRNILQPSHRRQSYRCQ